MRWQDAGNKMKRASTSQCSQKRASTCGASTRSSKMACSRLRWKILEGCIVEMYQKMYCGNVSWIVLYLRDVLLLWISLL